MSGDDVGDAGGVDAGADVVGADDVHPFQNGGGFRGDGSVGTIVDGGVFAIALEHASDEGFARDSGEQRVAKLVEFVESSQERIVVFEILAEAKAGIDHDAFTFDAGHGGGVGPVAEFALGEHHDVGYGREFAPFFGASTHVHQDGAAFEFGDGFGHLGVPTEGADVVDDFCAGFDGGTCDAGFVGVDGDDGGRTFLLQLGNNGKDAIALFFLGDGLGGLGGFARCRGVDAGTGAGGFAADVDDIGALVEKAEGVFDRFLGIEKVSTVGKRIRRDVHDTHHERALAEREGTRSDVPVEDGAHSGILKQVSGVGCQDSVVGPWLLVVGGREAVFDVRFSVFGFLCSGFGLLPGAWIEGDTPSGQPAGRRRYIAEQGLRPKTGYRMPNTNQAALFSMLE